MIAAIVYGALAKAEFAAPAAVQGTFIAADHFFTAFAAVGKVLKTARPTCSWSTHMPMRSADGLCHLGTRSGERARPGRPSRLQKIPQACCGPLGAAV